MSVSVSMHETEPLAYTVRGGGAALYEAEPPSYAPRRLAAAAAAAARRPALPGSPPSVWGLEFRV